jgi:hypothetical protein
MKNPKTRRRVMATVPKRQRPRLRVPRDEATREAFDTFSGQWVDDTHAIEETDGGMGVLANINLASINARVIEGGLVVIDNRFICTPEFLKSTLARVVQRTPAR